jgi:hypothetical protein
MLSQHNSDLLKQRFPSFEHSYETVIHKNVPENYNLALAIPVGRKSFAWFTFYKDTDVLYQMDLDKDKKIVKTTRIESKFDGALSIGTILYGIVLPDTNAFIIEDIHFYKGVPMHSLTFGEKLHYIHLLLSDTISGAIRFVLPVLWYNTQRECDIIPEFVKQYTVHHIQYRSLTHIVPYLNYQVNRRPNTDKDKDKDKIVPIVVQRHQTLSSPDFTKPQYRHPAIFHVVADIKCDIYHLYASDAKGSVVYYNTAYIPNYKTSVMMNTLFRNIKENKNLDYIEESEDEEEFENIREDRFVDLQKIVYMECVFNYKFKRWTPVKVLNDRNRVVHISKLVR